MSLSITGSIHVEIPSERSKDKDIRLKSSDNIKTVTQLADVVFRQMDISASDRDKYEILCNGIPIQESDFKSLHESIVHHAALVLKLKSAPPPKAKLRRREVAASTSSSSTEATREKTEAADDIAKANFLKKVKDLERDLGRGLQKIREKSGRPYTEYFIKRYTSLKQELHELEATFSGKMSEVRGKDQIKNWDEVYHALEIIPPILEDINNITTFDHVFKKWLHTNESLDLRTWSPSSLQALLNFAKAHGDTSLYKHCKAMLIEKNSFIAAHCCLTQTLRKAPKNESEALHAYLSNLRYPWLQPHEKANAHFGLGYCYEHGLGGLKKDMKQAAEHYTQATRDFTLLNEEAQRYLGSCFENGLGGLPKNEKRAAELYKLSADQGNEAAQAALGRFYEHGLGELPKDEKRALELYESAAKEGNTLALEAMGRFHELGLGGLPKDEKRANKFYEELFAREKGTAPPTPPPPKRRDMHLKQE